MMRSDGADGLKQHISFDIFIFFVYAVLVDSIWLY